MMKIAKYCCYDGKVTKCVHEYSIEHSHPKYNDRNGNITQVDVDWA